MPRTHHQDPLLHPADALSMVAAPALTTLPALITTTQTLRQLALLLSAPLYPGDCNAQDKRSDPLTDTKSEVLIQAVKLPTVGEHLLLVNDRLDFPEESLLPNVSTHEG